MSKSTYEKEVTEKMKKTVVHYEEELKKLRTGRPSPAMFEDIRIDYYGTPTPVNQTGSVTVTEDRTVVISPWEKSLLEKIEKAINAANLGIHAINDGSVVRVAFPSPTGEDRKKWVKHAKDMMEETKIALRNIRRDDIKKVKDDQKSSLISEDESKKAEEEITKILKEYEEKSEAVFAKKEKEIMES
ncbi:MAG: ribosome recycling factor [Thermotogae bacterium]|jgi:ribosome recycling factor|nr:ribosome recycling factor [Thermotogota bacterium]MCP5465109.1 ribosome recycling factor [Thermotogota bacterium]HOO75881.1 ribosome recycling factor [Tepiditoga sp.]